MKQVTKEIEGHVSRVCHQKAKKEMPERMKSVCLE